ncbi:hypothetical protein [Zhihengliuella flava]|uniref:Uncharacterized protein n=1 Tax=Zhihengliuella flava TaxID=1285193 RepID=A0A931GEG4_9MICC|nr:hypothetical protein [Zhihengliuella flava]MBG6084393.1 hypothetical protein [Zhihengliuella flava]
MTTEPFENKTRGAQNSDIEKLKNVLKYQELKTREHLLGRIQDEPDPARARAMAESYALITGTFGGRT